MAIYGSSTLSSSTVNDPDGAGPLKGWEVFNKVAGGAVPLFQATDEISYPAPGNPQPITAEPRVTTHPIKGLYVAFGTGKMFEPTDPSILQTQGIYVLWDQNNILPLTKSQLQRIRLEEFPFDHDSLTPARRMSSSGASMPEIWVCMTGTIRGFTFR